MINVNFETLMQYNVQLTLRQIDPEANCYIYNLPTDDNTSPVCGVVIPTGGPVGEAQKSVTLQVRVRGREESIAAQAIEAVYESLKDKEFQPGAYNTFKVICTALSTPSFMGLDDAGQPLFICIFELNSVY